jgi:azurin
MISLRHFSRIVALALVAVGATAGAADPADSEAPAATPAAKSKDGSAKKPKKVKIEMRDGMRFEPPRFDGNPGQEVIISLENEDSTHQPHNFVVLQPGKREEIVQQALALGDKGPASDYIPANPSIIVHSALLTPEAKNTVHFNLPTEKGIYPYVCTMPGHGLVMYGAIYVGVKMPPLTKDPNIPQLAIQAAIPGGGQRPFVQREFLPNTGPASLAVALPGEQNFCWDAGQCRLRYIWRGTFIDASANWHGNGRDLAVVPTDPWWGAEENGYPLSVGGQHAPVKFLGYKLDGGIPEFHYRVGAQEVFEKITPLPGNSGIAEQFRIPKATQPVKFAVAAGGASLGGDVGAAAHTKDFTITYTQPATTTAAPAHP